MANPSATASMTGSGEPTDRLRRSEEDFRLLVASVRDYAIYMLDPDGVVVSWNAGAERLKGYRELEILGQHFSVFYAPEDRDAGKPGMLLEIARREGRVEDEGWRIRKDGSRFWADVVITAVYDPDGSLRGYAKVTRDLTERRRAEEDRLHLVEAQEAVRLRDEFLSIASHELRTPLNVLSLSFQTLEFAFPPDAPLLRERLEKARRQLRRIIELVNRLLDVTRIAEGKLALVYAPGDLVETVVAVVDTLRNEAERVGCTLELTLPPQFEATYDRLRLEQLLMNVLHNAIKFGAGKPIGIQLERAPRSAVLRVRDEGVGIEQSSQELIFARFGQASSERAHKGLGLGLYIAQRIAEAHGGSISVDSTPGAGATFTITLPLEPSLPS